MTFGYFLSITQTHNVTMCIKNVTEKFCGLRFRFEENQGKVYEEGVEGCGCELECVV